MRDSCWQWHECWLLADVFHRCWPSWHDSWGPGKREDGRPINVTFQVHSTYDIRPGRAKEVDSGASHCFVSAKSGARNSVSVLIFLLTGCAFNAKGVSAAPLGSPACLSGSAMIHKDVLSLLSNLLEVLLAFRVFRPNPLVHVLKTWFETKCEERLLWNRAGEKKKSVTHRGTFENDRRWLPWHADAVVAA